ncbi:MAG: acyl-CoA thioester hydrolase [Granulosicoccus sp.]|jgi:acyl-CoA thioester hydrolase
MANSEGKLLHQSDFPIRWGDMDAMGHVNNVMYFRYFEQVRMEWYDQAGFASLHSEPQGIVIVDNHAEYLKPVTYPMHINVQMFGHSLGRSSFISSYLLTVDNVLFTRGSAKVVWIDTVAGKSIPLPADVRAMLTTEPSSP